MTIAGLASRVLRSAFVQAPCASAPFGGPLRSEGPIWRSPWASPVGLRQLQHRAHWFGHNVCDACGVGGVAWRYEVAHVGPFNRVCRGGSGACRLPSGTAGCFVNRGSRDGGGRIAMGIPQVGVRILLSFRWRRDGGRCGRRSGPRRSPETHRTRAARSFLAKTTGSRPLASTIVSPLSLKK